MDAALTASYAGLEATLKESQRLTHDCDQHDRSTAHHVAQAQHEVAEAMKHLKGYMGDQDWVGYPTGEAYRCMLQCQGALEKAYISTIDQACSMEELKVTGLFKKAPHCMRPAPEKASWGTAPYI